MGSATIASTRNLKRHFVTASQYANGSPTMNRISVVREASRTLSQIASRSMVHYSNSYPDDRCSSQMWWPAQFRNSLTSGTQRHSWPPREYRPEPGIGLTTKPRTAQHGGGNQAPERHFCASAGGLLPRGARVR